VNIGSAVVGTLNRGPLLSTEDVFVKKGRGLPIHGFVGPNGAGKSLLAALQTLPTLRGISWACDNPDHLHTRRGETTGTRRVLSTMPFITPSGNPHPLYVPLTDYSQIIFAEHVDLILDEVGGAVASSTGDDIPIGVKASLQELRRREVVCRWTAPSWSRASKVLREVSQGVTLSMGFMPVPHNDAVPFAGPHDTEKMSVDGETLEWDKCLVEGDHVHPSGRLWGARRLMYARTFDANTFDEWTTAKREKVRPWPGICSGVPVPLLKSLKTRSATSKSSTKLPTRAPVTTARDTGPGRSAAVSLPLQLGESVGAVPLWLPMMVWKLWATLIMFTPDVRGESCRLSYMETTNHAKRLLEAQMLVRQQLADKGLQLDDALSVVAARKSELRQIVLDAVDVGLTEVEAAKLAGVARSTVREWLGKKT
jgi:hypothetical protein